MKIGDERPCRPEEEDVVSKPQGFRRQTVRDLVGKTPVALADYERYRRNATGTTQARLLEQCHAFISYADVMRIMPKHGLRRFKRL